MCGRFTLTSPGELIAEVFGLDEAPELKPRYNIAPTQEITVVRLAPTGGRKASGLRWGLVPARWKEPHGQRPLLNARSETALSRGAFSEAFRHRRCLIPADGFYEWQAVPGEKRKRPHLITTRTPSPFAMAGLFEEAHPLDESSPGSCTILTTRANELLVPIHDRMPVILPPEAYGAWLDPSASLRPAELLGLLVPFPAEAMTAVRVGPSVNSAANDGPECLSPFHGGLSF